MLGGGKMAGGMPAVTAIACQASRNTSAVATGSTTASCPAHKLARSAGGLLAEARGADARSSTMSMARCAGARTRQLDLAAQQGAQLVELRAFADCSVARARERDRNLEDDLRGPASHDQHPIGEQHRLADAVGDKQHGLAIAVPQLQ